MTGVNCADCIVWVHIQHRTMCQSIGYIFNSIVAVWFESAAQILWFYGSGHFNLLESLTQRTIVEDDHTYFDKGKFFGVPIQPIRLITVSLYSVREMSWLGCEAVSCNPMLK
jgi:hypothetical protein